MSPAHRFCLAALVFLAPLTAAYTTTAAAQEDDAEVARLSAARKPVKSNWTPPGKSERFGHAETLVNAPKTAVLAQVQAFGSYREFAPSRFKTSRVVGREGPDTLVYVQVSVLHGVLTLWAQQRFTPPRSAGASTDIVEGTMMKGNVKALDVIWTVRAIDEKRTVLKCDLLLLPKFPAPQSALDEELADGAEQAVNGVQGKAQTSYEQASQGK